jgi:hypothetical protein
MQARNERRLREECEGREVRLADEIKRYSDSESQRKRHDQEARIKFESERKRLVEAQKVNESIGMMLREVCVYVCVCMS